MKAGLTAKAEAALSAARANPTQKTRQAAIDASRALSNWIIANEPAKKGPFSSRSNLAGKRQFAEHCARHRVRTL